MLRMSGVTVLRVVSRILNKSQIWRSVDSSRRAKHFDPKLDSTVSLVPKQRDDDYRPSPSALGPLDRGARRSAY